MKRKTWYAWIAVVGLLLCASSVFSQTFKLTPGHGEWTGKQVTMVADINPAYANKANVQILDVTFYVRPPGGAWTQFAVDNSLPVFNGTFNSTVYVPVANYNDLAVPAVALPSLDHWAGLETSPGLDVRADFNYKENGVPQTPMQVAITLKIDNETPKPVELRSFGRRETDPGPPFFWRNLKYYAGGQYVDGGTTSPAMLVCQTIIPLEWPVTGDIAGGAGADHGSGDPANAGKLLYRFDSNQEGPSFVPSFVTMGPTLPATAYLGAGDGLYWLHITTFDNNRVSDENRNHSATLHYGPILVDTTPPVIQSCAKNVSVNCMDSLDPAVNPNLGYPVAVDPAPGGGLADPPNTYTYTDTVQAGPCNGSYTIIRKWFAWDKCGNFSNCYQTITVTPWFQITCPPAKQVQCNESTDPTNTGNLSLTDPCNIKPVVGYQDSAVGGQCPVSQVITRTWTATGCGLTATCQQTITVVDTIAPVPDATTLTTVSGECSVTLKTAPTATDACSGKVTGTTPQTVFNTQGTFTVIWTYADACNNTSTQTQTVIVDDTQAPVPTVTTLSDLKGECSVEVTKAPTANDACVGLVTGTTTPPLPLTFSTQGTFTVIWSYTDGNGNTSTQTQTVIVDDTQPPAFSCPPGMTVPCDAVPAAYADLPAFLNANGMAMDTCCLDDKSFRLVGTATTSAPCQTLTRTYEVADCAGNTSQCTQVIQVKELVLSIDDTYVGRPGNWVTVQIKAKNCNPLQQLVFAVQFAPWLQYVPGSVTGVPTRVTATPAVEDLGGGTLLISLDSPSGGMVLNDSMSPRGEVFMSLTFRIGALTSLPASTPLTVVGNVFYATGMNGLEVCHDEDNGLLTVTTCFWLLDVDQNGTVDSNDGLWIYNVFKYHLITNPILNQKPVIPTDTPNRSLLPTDAQLIAYVVALIGCEDMDVDNDSSILATRDGVYFYRWLRYHGTSATVPPDHTSNLPFETLISNAIKALELTQRCPQNLYDIPCVPPGPGPTP